MMKFDRDISTKNRGQRYQEKIKRTRIIKPRKSYKSNKTREREFIDEEFPPKASLKIWKERNFVEKEKKRNRICTEREFVEREREREIL